ncbi:MAG: hypothetical protein VB141_11935 [Burkholderia gladioli]
MNTRPSPLLAAPMQALGDHLAAVAELLDMPEVAAQIGEGLRRELTYPIVSFRARFPHYLPGSGLGRS